jgi:hypothetical protein
MQRDGEPLPLALMSLRLTWLMPIAGPSVALPMLARRRLALLPLVPSDSFDANSAPLAVVVVAESARRARSTAATAADLIIME